MPEIHAIGPRTFIGPPFEGCPACGADDGLGLLLVAPTQYVKRCVECLATQQRPLPSAPTPHVLYLDQFAISNLARALAPEHRERFSSDDPVTQRGFWPRFFGRLGRLVRLGLLVCPPSSIHRAESMLDDRIADSLHRLHLHLSGDALLIHHEQVKRDQLYLAFCGWLDGAAPRTLTRKQVVRGGGTWLERQQVGLQVEIDPREIDEQRARRAAAEPALQAIVDEWRRQEGRSFADRWDEQLRKFGPALLPLLPLGDTRTLLVGALSDRGVPPDQWQGAIETFLTGEEVMAVPFARLACGLFAALGWQAARDQGTAVDRGTCNDVQAIATYAPYCDAMLVDRRCRRLLMETSLREQLPDGLRVFDVRTIDELEVWLDDVEADAPEGHVELVRRVYGDDWLKPYTSVLEAERHHDHPGSGPLTAS